MLELFVRDDVPDPERSPVTQELIESLREALAEGFDLEECLFHLAVAIMGLETELIKARGRVIDLETRILKAGLRVQPPSDS